MRIEGLSKIADQFDAMLIDQFGVIHDGHKLYSGAAQALKELRARSIPVVIMTNSGKRAEASVRRTVRLGIPRDHFVDCVSSGEVAYQSLDVKTAFLIGKHGEDYGFDPIECVSNPADAEVMLILGTNFPDTSMEQYEAMLHDINLPCVCCNPDRLMISPLGLLPASGAIAEIYESMNRPVRWIGKPHREIYDFALDLLERPERVLCIGDSPEHDVAGGRAAGLSTLLVQQGVAADLSEEAIDPRPNYILRDFRW
jgi:HAD superfamily hydrolase (TIGR01459 family)